MSAPSHDLLHLPLVFLGAAVLAVPLARWARLGSILGYLVAGVLIGPQVLGLVSAPDTILEVAEIGVVLMMFLVGLELEPRRLWQLRRPIFGWGSLQLLGSTALLMALALLCGLPWRLALVGSLGLAMSSTAVAMAVLGERNLGPTAAGQSILSVALLQDIAAIPSWRWCRPWPAPTAVAHKATGRRSRRWGRSPCSSWEGGWPCVRLCAGSPAAPRPRSSPPPRCCWCSRPRP